MIDGPGNQCEHARELRTRNGAILDGNIAHHAHLAVGFIEHIARHPNPPVRREHRLAHRAAMGKLGNRVNLRHTDAQHAALLLQHDMQQEALLAIMRVKVVLGGNRNNDFVVLARGAKVAANLSDPSDKVCESQRHALVLSVA